MFCDEICGSIPRRAGIIVMVSISILDYLFKKFNNLVLNLRFINNFFISFMILSIYRATPLLWNSFDCYPLEVNFRPFD